PVQRRDDVLGDGPVVGRVDLYARVGLMAAVYPEIRLTWQGRTYLVKVTMALLNRLEQHFSLARLAHRISTGDTPLSHLAVMVGEMLRSEGADVTDDEVLAELLTGDTEAVQQM